MALPSSRTARVTPNNLVLGGNPTLKSSQFKKVSRPFGEDPKSACGSLKKLLSVLYDLNIIQYIIVMYKIPQLH